MNGIDQSLTINGKNGQCTITIPALLRKLVFGDLTEIKIVPGSEIVNGKDRAFLKIYVPDEHRIFK